METPDFVIIGGGIAGASAAFELAEYGKTIVGGKKSGRPAVAPAGGSAALLAEAWEAGVVRSSHERQPADSSKNLPRVSPTTPCFHLCLSADQPMTGVASSPRSPMMPCPLRA